MLYWQLLATIGLAAVIVIAYALAGDYSSKPIGGGGLLDLGKLRVTCKVKCGQGTAKRECAYTAATQCRRDLKEGCSPKKQGLKAKN